jgi:predicted aspartyl protease
MFVPRILKISFFFLFVLVIVTSCAKERKRPIYNRVSRSHSDDTDFSRNVAIPFRESGGVKLVNVKVNGIAFEMIFDTGCSGTLMSIAEAIYLYQKGDLTDDDFIGTSKAMIADGSIVENMVVNLKSVIIDNKIECDNVIATVSGNISAPLLLGNEVLDRVAVVSIDNDKKVINFKLRK